MTRGHALRDVQESQPSVTRPVRLSKAQSQRREEQVKDWTLRG